MSPYVGKSMDRKRNARLPESEWRGKIQSALIAALPPSGRSA